jgi:acyl-homoserine-lactone acylase
LNSFFTKYTFLLYLLPVQLLAQSFSKEEIARWEQQAQQVTIIRDNWGIPHIYGKTDADAVFGLMYAQCEDDFQRVEMNYIEKLGRLSEIKGESKLQDDLLIRLLIDSTAAKADYKAAPEWLKKLLNAHADGINYYLYKHPQVQPSLLNRFQPWFHLLWTDGSIGAISTADITSKEVKNLYLEKDSLTTVPVAKEENPSGSNGFALAPAITASHHAILYINPHVTFYFRPEVHVVSKEGLNAYGAVTWGQFFVYQGFNEHCGWMHTSSYVDVADTYIEKINSIQGKWIYEYEHQQKTVLQKQITLRYLKGNKLLKKTVHAAYTGHGPIMAKRNGAYISLKSNNRSVTSLIQSWKRTKTKSFAEYKEVMNLLANTSNNTVYADAEGNIAYWHGNFIPIRDTTYDWAKPVDGTTKATEWKGLHSVDASVHLYNPTNGWIQNCNSTPFTCAGKNSPKKGNYPNYYAPDGENFRGINAVRVLEQQQKPHTLNTIITAGYNTYMPAFELMVPSLITAFEKNSSPIDSSLLAEPIAILKNWDYHCNEQSIATTLAVDWAERLSPAIAQTAIADPYNLNTVEKTKRYFVTVSPDQLLQTFATTINHLKTNFGTWQIPWGDINRYQRLSGQLDLQYNDQEKSIPVGYASSAWGTLPSYRSQVFPGTKKRYGYNGNSFICAVEFGEKIKAKSLLAGGESGSPQSPHFNDQAEMFSRGEFKDVLFYKEDVLKQAVKTYHPGDN